MNRCRKCGSKLKTRLIREYKANELGIAGVSIWNAVSEETCPKCNNRQSVIIPNLQGLVAAIAVLRIAIPFKLSGSEIRFLRKAMEWPAKKLAEKLDGHIKATSTPAKGSTFILSLQVH